MQARQLIYTGRVQGVGFRWSVRDIAAGFDLSGFVRNLPDGTVELCLQGEPDEMDAMQQAIQESHLGGFIRNAEQKEMTVDLQMKGFEIR